ncbi:uncharacterized protein RCC_10804 [Ramularia collo-cygni]|uniref:RBR-type E3 ubiquitin transferase n=1 Tax=Ramularia collo-cygni TaxID=112498 RepID=A0A2D3VPM4_9PEZI|nr:uncharacterized protein RCC_10804 [Ramularia collo-cygni]CZT25074.1 uncharacterized protein RCC_10804 [Ramularia collo-cygni]
MARNLRSNVNALANVADIQTYEEATAPPKKRKKVQAPRFRCSSCSTLRMTKFFPNFNPSSECEHLINTCIACLRKWVEARVEGGTFEFGKDGKMFGVRCPECPEVMREVNVQNAATKKVFKRFQELERRHVADTVPNWRWCLNPTCKAGQVHEQLPEPRKTAKGGKNSKKQPSDEAEKICVCNECGHRACVPCDRPDHTPETCADYQNRIKGRTDEDDKSRAMLLKISKPCPHCNKPIQKSGGCSSMMCAVCHTNFCWECLKAYTANGCGCTTQQHIRNAVAAAGLL